MTPFVRFASLPCCPSARKISRLCRERERALIFRGWSRLCLHAASLSAAEGASASATAMARAARAEAVKREAAAAANAAAEQMEGVDLVRRRTRAILLVRGFLLSSPKKLDKVRV